MPFIVPLRSVVVMLLLFAAAYFPAFALSGGLHLPPDRMVPTVMGVSFTVAAALMAFAIWRGWFTTVDFGLRWPAPRDLLLACGLGIPASALIAWGMSHAHEPGPLGGLTLTPWQVYLCFAVGAPIQEETIFRGLLQSTLAKSLTGAPAIAAVSAIAASVLVAALFGAVHLVVGPWTALAALVLGVFAGELRRRSGSLLPAIVCHAIFNLGGMVWPAH